MSRDYNPISRGGQIRRREVDRLAGFSSSIAASWCLGPLQGMVSSGGLSTFAPPAEIYVQITGAQKGDNSFPWTQLVEVTPAAFDKPANALTDSDIPLFEVNDESVPENTIVRAWLSDNGTHYLFYAGVPPQGITIRELADGIPTVANVSEIDTVRSTGLDLQALGSGTILASTTATWTKGTQTMTVASATGIAVGQPLQAIGIPPGALVTGINNFTVTFQPAATADGTNATVSFFAGGKVQLQVLAASPTQAGAVNTSAQSWLGPKTFQSQAFFDPGQSGVGSFIPGAVVINPVSSFIFAGVDAAIIQGHMVSALDGKTPAACILGMESDGSHLSLSCGPESSYGQSGLPGGSSVMPGANMELSETILSMAGSDSGSNTWSIVIHTAAGSILLTSSIPGGNTISVGLTADNQNRPILTVTGANTGYSGIYATLFDGSTVSSGLITAKGAGPNSLDFGTW